MSRNYFVNKAGDPWAVQREGALRPSFRFDTQTKAIARGRKLAKQSRGELTIFAVNGRIRSKDSYGNDPARIRDTEH